MMKWKFVYKKDKQLKTQPQQQPEQYQQYQQYQQFQQYQQQQQYQQFQQYQQQYQYQHQQQCLQPEYYDGIIPQYHEVSDNDISKLELCNLDLNNEFNPYDESTPLLSNKNTEYNFDLINELKTKLNLDSYGLKKQNFTTLL